MYFSSVSLQKNKCKIHAIIINYVLQTRKVNRKGKKYNSIYITIVTIGDNKFGKILLNYSNLRCNMWCHVAEGIILLLHSYFFRYISYYFQNIANIIHIWNLLRFFSTAKHVNCANFRYDRKLNSQNTQLLKITSRKQRTSLFVRFLRETRSVILNIFITAYYTNDLVKPEELCQNVIVVREVHAAR